MSKELTPLEALESLMENYFEMCLDTCNNDDQYQRYNLTSEYHIIEKSLKALEIIKENFEISKPIGIDIENNRVAFGCLIQKKDLTQEEYDLLKEVLVCD